MKVLVVGANVGGAVCAAYLAACGAEVTLAERDLARKKPCGGAVPPKAFSEFGIPREIIERRVRRAVCIGPSGREIAMDVRGSVPRDDDYIAMVTRETLDRTMRAKAQSAGATLVEAAFTAKDDLPDGRIRATLRRRDGTEHVATYDALVGADGAGSTVAKACGRPAQRFASAIQERLRLPDEEMARYENRAELYLGDDVSPDFYGWVFPKSDHVAVGTGCAPAHANRSYAYLEGVKARAGDKLRGARRVLLEGHPLPMTRFRRFVYGRTLLVGDAAGMVAHTSGEGIYFAMAAGKMAAETLMAFAGDQRASLTRYERDWQRAYGSMFDFLEFLERASYTSHRKREFFTAMCGHADVQALTFDSYLHKAMASVRPAHHLRIACASASVAVQTWLRPPAALADGPPSITAKAALAATRAAITDGVRADADLAPVG